MAAKHTIIIVATIFVLTLCNGTMGQAPASAPEPAVAFGPSAEAPMPDCLTNLLNLTDCLSYVQTGSNRTKPEKPCCPELAGLVESSPQCLCYLLDKNATASYGIDIDMKRALNLPTICHVSTPPVSLCSGINGAGPTSSEAPMSPGPAPEGFAASPKDGRSNRASNIAVSGLASLLALAIAFMPTLFMI